MLKRSKDRKVTNAITPGGNVAIANTFGLPAGKDYSCPSQTAYCERICYAGKLEKIYKGVRSTLMHNWNLLKDASYNEMFDLLNEMIYSFEDDCHRRNAERNFRIHWDGDFFSQDYLDAWVMVILEHPFTKFWVYTRVESAALDLHAIQPKNLNYYYSADPDNLHIARELQDKGIKIAYVGNTFAEGKEVFVTATKCPENNKALPLISEKGSACQICKLCVDGRKDVLFSVSKK